MFQSAASLILQTDKAAMSYCNYEICKNKNLLLILLYFKFLSCHPMRCVMTISPRQFSLPLPQGGRDAITKNLILREDQLPQKYLYPKTKKKANKKVKIFTSIVLSSYAFITSPGIAASRISQSF